MTKLVIIAARSRNSVIGFNGGLPWSVPEDLAFFKRVTTGYPVIMGRKTHESIGFALPGRENIVITTKASRQFKGCITATSLESALAYCRFRKIEQAFLVGGGMLYKQGLAIADQLLITEIDQDFTGDTFFPVVMPELWTQTERDERVSMANGIKFAFVTYEPRQVVEERLRAENAQQLLTPMERWTNDFLSSLHGTRSYHKNKGLTMKQYKHPGHILAIDKDFTDNLPGMGLVHGLTRLTEDEYKTWLSVVGAESVIRQRDGLEANPNYRQLLPYSPIVFQEDEAFNAGLPINWETDEISTYQRTKTVGEARLGGKYSIGYGGHVDHTDVKHDVKSILNIEGTINHNLQREVALEELAFETAGGGVQANPLDTPHLFRFEHLGFIRDDSNNVGKVHLGLVNLIVVPKSLQARVNETELRDGPRATVKQLKEMGLDFENWTQILIDELSGSKLTVHPAVVRTPIFDPLTHQYYIEAVKGDKLTELAIELHTTVNRIKRLNLHLQGELSVGQRVNVPYVEEVLPPVAIPADWLQGDVSLEEQHRAVFTVKFLKLVKESALDTEKSGMRYLVTADMLNRLLTLEPTLQPLVDAGVLKVVEDEAAPQTLGGARFITEEQVQ
jgi:dihydrofolate reductase